MAKAYGINTFGLTTDQLLALDYWAPRMDAEAMLETARGGEIKLTPKGWYDLTLYTTGSEDAATKCHNVAVFAQMKDGGEVGEVNA